jgi:hypothetical protein
MIILIMSCLGLRSGLEHRHLSAGRIVICTFDMPNVDLILKYKLCYISETTLDKDKLKEAELRY